MNGGKMNQSLWVKCAVLMLSFGFVSCGPRDVAVENSASGGNAGQPVTVSTQGQRSSTCPQNMSDHTNLRSPFELDQKVFSGKVTAAIGAGDRNCFRVGSTVNLQNGTQGEARAQVKVTKVEAFPLTSLTAAHAAFFDMTVEELKALAEKEISTAPFNSKGWVNITHFEYISGSATVTPQSEDIVVIDKEGDRALTCPATMADHTNLRSPVEFDEKVYSGKVTAALNAGDRNCFKIGAEVNLQNGTTAPSRGKVKVVKVEIVPLAKLTAYHAKALDMTIEEAKALADKEISTAPFNSKATVNVTYFTYVSGGPTAGGAPASGILVVDQEGVRPTTCPANMADHTNLRSPVEFDEKVFAGKITAAVGAGDRNCFKIGSVVNLKNGNQGDVRGEVKVVKVEILLYTELSDEHAKALDMTLDEIKAYAQKEIASAPFDAKGKVNITHFEYGSVSSGGGPTEVVIPPQSETLYKLLAPTLKSEIEKRLALVLEQQGIVWDKSSLTVTFERLLTVELQGGMSLLPSGVGSGALYPAYKVTFKTQKGNTLVLANNESSGPLWLMESSGKVENVTDIEGAILSVEEKWYALKLSPVLINAETKEKSKIDLGDLFEKFFLLVP